MTKKLGKLTVISGPMFSGKTSKLLAIVEVLTAMGHRVLVVKPEIDNRYGKQEEIRTHDSRSATAMLVKDETAKQMLQKIATTSADKVIFDEVQFFDSKTILAVIDQLREQ